MPVQIDIVSARESYRNFLRYARAPKLLALDVEFRRALERQGSTATIAAQSQVLRDLPQNIAIDTAKTTEELLALWPNDLLGPLKSSQ